MDRIFAKLLYCMEKQQDTMLVTIIADQGSAPRGAGSQMLVGNEGRILGTIGGGAVEGRADAMARTFLESRSSGVHLFQLHENARENIGMVCGGDVRVLFQYIAWDDTAWKTLAQTALDRIQGRQSGWLCLSAESASPSLVDGGGQTVFGPEILGEQNKDGWRPIGSGDIFALPLPIGERAIIFGGGHCAQALAPLLHTVGFRVTVFDERSEYACRENFPTAECILTGDYTKLADSFEFTTDDYIVVMTNGHSYDLEVQDQVLRGDFAYVGVIGSKKKTAAVNQKLLERGVSQEAISRVHTPIGTSIKAVTPEEIAVSITGELILTRAIRREAIGFVPQGCPMH